MTTDPIADLDAGKAALAVLLASLPGASRHRHADVGWVDSGVADAVFNGVFAGPGVGTDDAVAAVVRHFRDRGRPFHWEIGLRGGAAGAGAVLERHGLEFDETEPAMWLGLDSLPPPPQAVPGLTIRPVTDRAMVREWVEVWGCGAPAGVTDRWYEVYANLPFGPGGPLRMFVAYLDDRPAGTVYTFVAGDVGTVHYVVTLPDLRRRGIGAALTHQALRAAADAGCRTAVLTASPDGIGIYRRFGFRECGSVSTYVWSP